jgi:dihydrofolate reductase
MATVFYTATTLDGFIATPDHSLEWLFVRDNDPGGPLGWSSFEGRIGVSVLGANTYQWMLDHVPPDEFTGGESWVFTHRDFGPREGVTFTDAPVADVHPDLVAAAGDKDVWVIGGGGLAVQFADAGLLDEVIVNIAPVSLGEGAPLLPGHVELRLEETARNRDFVGVRYSVVK